MLVMFKNVKSLDFCFQQNEEKKIEWFLGRQFVHIKIIRLNVF